MSTPDPEPSATVEVSVDLPETPEEPEEQSPPATDVVVVQAPPTPPSASDTALLVTLAERMSALEANQEMLLAATARTETVAENAAAIAEVAVEIAEDKEEPPSPDDVPEEEHWFFRSPKRWFGKGDN